MPSYISSIRNARLEQATLQQQTQEIKNQLQHTHETLQGLIAFVMGEHLTVHTFRAFWRQEERAILALRNIGQMLGLELSEVARSVFQQLDDTEKMSLLEFQTDEAAHLFATIDSIEPDEDQIGDGRGAAEKFQYAAEARSALLRYTLSVLSQRYPSYAFNTLGEATTWTNAFSALIQEAEQIIEGTRRLLYDEATAIQSHLDTLRNRFEFLEEQAHAAAVTIREDWRVLLEQAEAHILAQLNVRHEQLEQLAFGELKDARESGWLAAIAWQTARHAPVLGTLLLTLAGGSTLLKETRPSIPTLHIPPMVMEGASQMVQGVGNFPVVARRTEPLPTEALSLTNDEVSHFFSAQPRGRHTLTLSDGASLQRVLDELARYGYAHPDVLKLLGLNSVNEIVGPTTIDVRWSQGGRPLLLPPYQSPAPAIAAAAVPEAVAIPVRFEGESQPITSLVVHRVQPGETLRSVAERYTTTLTELQQDNRLADAEAHLQPGQMVLVRVSGRALTVQAPAAAAGTPLAVQVRSGGGFPTARVPTAIAPTLPSPLGTEGLVARHGSTIYPSVDEMPEDVRHYFTGTVQEVADFFNVRPGDIIGILQAENNNAGLRIYQPAVSSAGAQGVAQIVARTWNGWSNPQTDDFTADLRAIEQYGGLGFDWSMREAWRRWKSGEGDGSELAYSNADPARFENSVAGIARHLVQWGLTRDRAVANPEWYRQRLADAISVYNSGKPLAEAENFRQSADNRKTTGQYVREAMAIAEATPVNLIQPAHSAPLRDAYRQLMDQAFGVGLSESELEMAVDGSLIATRVAAGHQRPEDGAHELLNQTIEHYLAEGWAARAAGKPLPWPFIYDEKTLQAQQVAVQMVGRPLSPWELEPLLEQSNGEQEAIKRLLSTRGDARLFAGTIRVFDEALKRSERGLFVAKHEVANLVQTAVAGYTPQAMTVQQVQQAMEQIETTIRQLPEYREVNGATAFTATPLVPMPRIFKGFGTPVDYQQGGRHTGIDVANPPYHGQEPQLYAVAAARVVYVGPLYCDAPTACRGGNSIV
ncbi:MAG: LysM peptidoglycan-binding domain-containing protein, partial [Ardenticatenales bacterium]|nr:LysM peptidoglycan-binding domain-containing protein [Ardenticatenales bacterium]